MSLENYRLKLNKTGNHASDDIPQFSLSYKADPRNPCHTSYAILSALVGDADVVIELNTDLFDSNGSRECASQFLDGIVSLNLEYNHKKVPSQRKTSFLGFHVDNKSKTKADKITVYVPGKVWNSESIKDVLPVCGARYHITKESMDSKLILNEIDNMSEEEKLNAFKLIVFDYTQFGRMGISSEHLGTEELIRLLGL